jgi:hypothetical protein
MYSTIHHCKQLYKHIFPSVITVIQKDIWNRIWEMYNNVNNTQAAIIITLLNMAITVSSARIKQLVAKSMDNIV